MVASELGIYVSFSDQFLENKTNASRRCVFFFFYGKEGDVCLDRPDRSNGGWRASPTCMRGVSVCLSKGGQRKVEGVGGSGVLFSTLPDA